MSDIKIAIHSKSDGKTKTVVKARQFTLVIDEPRALGGGNQGANPVEYLLGALSGCLNVTAHMVAREMGFTLRSVEFEVEGLLDPTKFMGKHTEERAGFKEITVKVIPEADTDKATLKKWLAITESRCPVSCNVSNPTPIGLKLA